MESIQYVQIVVLGIHNHATFLHSKHRLHSSLENRIIERVMQYFKDRTESFDDYYYPCMQDEYNLFHV